MKQTEHIADSNNKWQKKSDVLFN